MRRLAFFLALLGGIGSVVGGCGGSGDLTFTHAAGSGGTSATSGTTGGQGGGSSQCPHIINGMESCTSVGAVCDAKSQCVCNAQLDIVLVDVYCGCGHTSLGNSWQCSPIDCSAACANGGTATSTGNGTSTSTGVSTSTSGATGSGSSTGTGAATSSGTGMMNPATPAGVCHALAEAQCPFPPDEAVCTAQFESLYGLGCDFELDTVMQCISTHPILCSDRGMPGTVDCGPEFDAADACLGP